MTTIEKFTKYGHESLTDKEMLSALIGPADANNLFDDYIALGNVVRQDWETIYHETFVCEQGAKKVELLCALSRRISEAKIDYSTAITAPAEAAGFLMPKLNHLGSEVFIVVFLNNAKKLMGYKKISDGGKTATIVDPAAVMKAAILKEASSIILAHNHPSGNLKESRADVKLTKRLKKSGKLLGITVDDHLIISNGDFISLRTKGVLS
jgi:DNA repair protein RadC